MTQTPVSAGVTFTYALTGLDSACNSLPGSAANSCGIHIHEGRSCYADAGGHFYATTADPWTTVTYTTTSGAVITSGSESVATGVTPLSENLGKTFIVHDYAGARIACGQITEPTFLQRLLAIPRVSPENCKNIVAIAKGSKKAAPASFPLNKSEKEMANSIRSMPILNEANCAKAYPVPYMRG